MILIISAVISILFPCSYNGEPPNLSAQQAAHIKARILLAGARERRAALRPTICALKKYIFLSTAGLLSREICKFAMLISISLNLWNLERAL